MNKLNSDIRDIFFDNIKKKFLKNKKYFLLTNDADVYSLKSLRKSNRFIDTGVAEQNLINIASGLAKCDRYPIVYGFCTFLTFRCYEQLKFNVGSHNLNVKIIGIGPGYSFSYDGPTHHGIQDLYLMYLIPEFEIINISDNNLANIVSQNINKLSGPIYIRLEKGALNYNLNIKYNLKKGFELTVRSKNKKILIITTGLFCKTANLNANKFNNVSVINFFKFKNYDKQKFLNEIKKYKNILIYDESSKSGGISPILSKLILQKQIKSKIYFLTSEDSQSFFYTQNRNDYYRYLNIDDKSLYNLIKSI
tara:strand:- start:50 stop:970 length:921 start_codon:yes stop_codon:yes gene_type:complete